MNSFRDAIRKGEPLRPGGPLRPEKKPTGATEYAGLTSIPVSRDEKRASNHRDEDRHRLAGERAVLRVDGSRHDVELVNLSGGGAMVSTEAELDMWQSVWLELGDCGELEGAVRWIRDNRVGIEFAPETQIGGDEEKTGEVLLEVIKRSFPDVKKAPKRKQRTRPSKAGAQSANQRQQRRDCTRHPLIWSGQILFDHDSSTVRLRNISETGALVECARHFPPEAEVLLDLGEAGQHFAVVSWSRGDQVGLRFASPFDIAALASTKPEVASTHWKAPDYLRRESGFSNESSRWNHASIDDLQRNLEGFLKR